jgi:hypothetical protein
MAITWASAATTAALEGAGSEILSEDTSDFENTIGIIEDSQEQYTSLQGGVFGLLKDEAGALLGEAGKSAVEVLEGVEQLLNPEDPDSDASEAETAAEEDLFSSGTGGAPPPNGGFDLSGQISESGYDPACQQSVPQYVLLSNLQIQFSDTSLSELISSGGMVTGNATFTYNEIMVTYTEAASGGIMPGSCQYPTTSYPQTGDAVLTVSPGGSGILYVGSFSTQWEVQVTSSGVNGTTSYSDQFGNTYTDTVSLSVSSGTSTDLRSHSKRSRR